MARTPKENTKPKKRPFCRRRLGYTQDDLKNAVKEIDEGKIGIREAAKKYGIPRSTLSFRRSPHFKKAECGPQPFLSKEEENLLVTWILECAKKGFPRRSLDLQLSVQEYLNSNPRDSKTPFKNNLPGKSWLQKFIKRHPDIVRRTSEAVTSASACVSKEDLQGWFSSVEELLRKDDLLNILEDPSRIYNGDETNFVLCPKGSKVLAKRGTKNLYEVDCAQAKSSITVMFSFSASGDLVPPMVVYPYKRLPREITDSVPNDWGIGRSDSGWMTSEVFFEFVGNVFNNHLIRKGIKKPVLLFVDGHKSHLTLQLSELCTECGIILVALYPNATRILQPADVAAFKPVKEGWKKAVLEWRRHNPLDQITKVHFATIFTSVLNSHVKKDTLINGFRASGIYPWNSSAIDPSKCLGTSKNQDSATVVFSPAPTLLTHDMFVKVVGDDLYKSLDREPCADKETCANKYYHALVAIKKVFETRSLPVTLSNVSGERPYMNTEHTTFSSSPTSNPIYSPNIPGATTPISRRSQSSLPNEMPVIPHGWDANVNISEGCTTALESTPISKRRQELNEEDNVPSRSVSPLCIGADQPAGSSAQDSQCYDSRTSNNASTSDPSKTVSSNLSSLNDVLVWPLTPKRKGKRNVKRMPYVLTSALWKQLHKEEDDRKKEELRKKQERAEKRRATKEEKEKLPARPKREKRLKPSKIAPKPSRALDFSETEANYNHDGDGEPHDETEDDCVIPLSPQEMFFEEDDSQPDAIPGTSSECQVGLCFSCGGGISRKKPGTMCDICDKAFHKTCIPSYASKLEIMSCANCDLMAEEMDPSLDAAFEDNL